jgi:hypothetical protein
MGYWGLRGPAIVAHEAASIHLISGGRFELGIGTGWYQPEYDAAGIAFGSAGQRLERLDASLGIIRQLLRLAARHADIVGALPAPIRHSTDGDDPRDRLPAAFDAKVGVLRDAADDRFGDLEISALGTFIVTGERRAATEDLIARRGWSGLRWRR